MELLIVDAGNSQDTGIIGIFDNDGKYHHHSTLKLHTVTCIIHCVKGQAHSRVCTMQTAEFTNNKN